MSASAYPELPGTIEYAVVDDHNHRSGFQTFTSHEAASEYLAWILELQDERRRDAEANEASGFEGGNEAWYRWNVGTAGRDGGYKDRTYRVVMRSITPWRDA